jgi:anti-sigma B factor antagonist
MDIHSREHGPVVILEPWGALDARGARDLERGVTGLIGKTDARIGIDCSRIDRITGPGLRAIVALSKRLAHVRGRLVLFALDPQLASVFDVAGPTLQLQIVTTQQEALAALSLSDVTSSPSDATALLARRVMRALHRSAHVEALANVRAPAPDADRPIEALAKRVVAALASSQTRRSA